MVDVEVLGVSDGPSHPLVLLRDDDRVLPIVVGINEASAIQVGLTGEKMGRPMTHDLVCNVLAGLQGTLRSVTIYKLENDTFYAHLNVERHAPDGTVEQVLRIDSRPSDGIAIAVRMKCPVLVADDVMDAAAQDLAIMNSDDEPEEPEGLDS